jgi:hypothetical protein
MKIGGGLIGTIGKAAYSLVADTLGKVGIQAGTNYYSQWQFSFRYGDPVNIWRLQRPYMFELMLPDLQTDTGWFGGVPGFEVSKYCQEMRFEDYKMDTKTIRAGAQQIHFAGHFDIGVMRAVFLKPVPDVVSQYFYSWRALITDGIHMHPKNNYAKPVYIRLFDRDGFESGIYLLTGVFPKTVTEIEMSMGGEGIVKLAIEFSVDRVKSA